MTTRLVLLLLSCSAILSYGYNTCSDPALRTEAKCDVNCKESCAYSADNTTCECVSCAANCASNQCATPQCFPHQTSAATFECKSGCPCTLSAGCSQVCGTGEYCSGVSASSCGCATCPVFGKCPSPLAHTCVSRTKSPSSVPPFCPSSGCALECPVDYPSPCKCDASKQACPSSTCTGVIGPDGITCDWSPCDTPTPTCVCPAVPVFCSDMSIKPTCLTSSSSSSSSSTPSTCLWSCRNADICSCDPKEKPCAASVCNPRTVNGVWTCSWSTDVCSAPPCTCDPVNKPAWCTSPLGTCTAADPKTCTWSCPQNACSCEGQTRPANCAGQCILTSRPDASPLTCSYDCPVDSCKTQCDQLPKPNCNSPSCSPVSTASGSTGCNWICPLPVPTPVVPTPVPTPVITPPCQTPGVCPAAALGSIVCSDGKPADCPPNACEWLCSATATKCVCSGAKPCDKSSCVGSLDANKRFSCTWNNDVCTVPQPAPACDAVACSSMVGTIGCGLTGAEVPPRCTPAGTSCGLVCPPNVRPCKCSFTVDDIKKFQSNCPSGSSIVIGCDSAGQCVPRCKCDTCPASTIKCSSASGSPICDMGAITSDDGVSTRACVWKCPCDCSNTIKPACPFGSPLQFCNADGTCDYTCPCQGKCVAPASCPNTAVCDFSTCTASCPSACTGCALSGVCPSGNPATCNKTSCQWGGCPDGDACVCDPKRVDAASLKCPSGSRIYPTCAISVSADGVKTSTCVLGECKCPPKACDTTNIKLPACSDGKPQTCDPTTGCEFGCQGCNMSTCPSEKPTCPGQIVVPVCPDGPCEYQCQYPPCYKNCLLRTSPCVTPATPVAVCSATDSSVCAGWSCYTPPKCTCNTLTASPDSFAPCLSGATPAPVCDAAGNCIGTTCPCTSKEGPTITCAAGESPVRSCNTATGTYVWKCAPCNCASASSFSPCQTGYNVISKCDWDGRCFPTCVPDECTTCTDSTNTITCTNNAVATCSTSTRCNWQCPTGSTPTCSKDSCTDADKALIRCPTTSANTVVNPFCDLSSKCLWTCPPPVEKCPRTLRPTCASPNVPVCLDSGSWVCPNSPCPSDACTSSTKPVGCASRCVGFFDNLGVCVKPTWTIGGCSDSATCTNGQTPVCQIVTNVVPPTCTSTCATCTGTEPCDRAVCIQDRLTGKYVWNDALCYSCDRSECSSSDPLPNPTDTCKSWSFQCQPIEWVPNTKFVAKCGNKVYCDTPIVTQTCTDTTCLDDLRPRCSNPISKKCTQHSDGLCRWTYLCPTSDDFTCNITDCEPSTKPFCKVGTFVSLSCDPNINPKGEQYCDWNLKCRPPQVCAPVDCTKCALTDSSLFVNSDTTYDEFNTKCGSINSCFLQRRTCISTDAAGCQWTGLSADCASPSTTATSTPTPAAPICKGTDECTCNYDEGCQFFKAFDRTKLASSTDALIALCLSPENYLSQLEAIKSRTNLSPLAEPITSKPPCTLPTPSPNPTPSPSTGVKDPISAVVDSNLGGFKETAQQGFAKDVQSAPDDSPLKKYAIIILVVYKLPEVSNTNAVDITCSMDFIGETQPTPDELKQVCPTAKRFITRSLGSAAVNFLGDCSWKLVSQSTKRQSTLTTSYDATVRVTSSTTPASSAAGLSAGFTLVVALVILAFVL